MVCIYIKTMRNTAEKPAAASVRVPAEWEPHEAIWTCWPSHPDLWPGRLLEQAREEIASMAQALAAGDRIKALAYGDEAVESARAMLGAKIKVIPAKFGDIWLRDTGPIFATYNGKLAALRFRLNGWGEKYIYEFDDSVGDAVADGVGMGAIRNDFILEGGAVEHDGQGTILTTRQCLLNRNRNKGWDEEKAEAALRAAFGAKKILWLDEGMLNDHTDGHIDNIARFVAKGRVVCQSASGKNDPNAAIFDSIARALESMTDATGKKLEVIRAPSPGRIEDENGDPIPASHMNFIIGNKTVAVPTYGTTSAAQAVAVIHDLFPNHKVVGLPSNAILTGGGSFHCITQQEPKA